MNFYIPNYYNSFICTKGNCKHTCCKGWEIDIDSDTYKHYQSINSTFKDSLLAGIESSPDGYHIRLDDEERCPFLNSDGLCDIVINLGFESLSQICRDHPLYRNFISNRCEIGLGLCCESAAELILNFESPIRLIPADTIDNSSELSDWDSTLLSLRNNLLSIAQDRSMPVLDRIHSIISSYGCSYTNITELAEFMKSLESMDNSWIVLLDTVSSISDSSISSASDNQLENFLIYLLYRHIVMSVDDSDFYMYLQFCISMFLLVYAISLNNSLDFIEICRLFSSEIEYSDENPELILNYLCFHS